MGFFGNDDGSDGIDFGQAIIKLLGGSEPDMAGAAPPAPPPPPPGGNTNSPGGLQDQSAAPMPPDPNAPQPGPVFGPGARQLGGWLQSGMDFAGRNAPKEDENGSPLQNAVAPPPETQGPPMPPPLPGGAAGMPPVQPLDAPPAPPPGPPPGNVPMPPPRPQLAQGATGTPPPARVPVGPGGGSTAPLPTVAPPSAQHGWLNGIFGGDPNKGIFGMDEKRGKAFGGALAEGLKSVGSNWNKPGLAAAAGSAGSALEGGNKAEDDFFKQTAEAKKEALAYAAAGEKSKLNETIMAWNKARAATILEHGTIQSRANDYRNSDLGRLQSADNIAQKQFEGWRKANEERQKDPDPAHQAQWQKDQEAKEKQFREEAYKRYGWSPEQAEKIKNTGQAVYSKDGKIDILATTGQAHQPKNWREFNAIVPQGAYYIDPGDHKLHGPRTTAPPPAANAPGGAATVMGPQEMLQGEGDPVYGA